MNAMNHDLVPWKMFEECPVVISSLLFTPLLLSCPFVSSPPVHSFSPVLLCPLLSSPLLSPPDFFLCMFIYPQIDYPFLFYLSKLISLRRTDCRPLPKKGPGVQCTHTCLYVICTPPYILLKWKQTISVIVSAAGVWLVLLMLTVTINNNVVSPHLSNFKRWLW